MTDHELRLWLGSLADDLAARARRADYADEAYKLRWMARGIWLAIEEFDSQVAR